MTTSKDDILERAKAVDPEMLAVLNWGALRDLISGLITEVERLRSDQDAIMAAWDKDAVEHDARIKELEAEAQEYHDKKEEALTLCAGQNRYIERLEAAFLKAEKANLMHHMDADYADETAREALVRIKAETGSGDHVVGANKLILTAEQREEEGKRDA